MVSWAVYPALDAIRPAGLSPTVIQQELRGRNRFTGVTITDALEAGALKAFGTTSQRAVTAAAVVNVTTKGGAEHIERPSLSAIQAVLTRGTEAATRSGSSSASPRTRSTGWGSR